MNKLTARVVAVDAIMTGVSQKGNKWCKQNFEIRQELDAYSREIPERALLSLFGEDAIQDADLKEGDIVEVGIWCDIHEYDRKDGSGKGKSNELQCRVYENKTSKARKAAAEGVGTPAAEEDENPF